MRGAHHGSPLILILWASPVTEVGSRSHHRALRIESSLLVGPRGVRGRLLSSGRAFGSVDLRGGCATVESRGIIPSGQVAGDRTTTSATVSGRAPDWAGPPEL